MPVTTKPSPTCPPSNPSEFDVFGDELEVIDVDSFEFEDILQRPKTSANICK